VSGDAGTPAMGTAFAWTDRKVREALGPVSGGTGSGGTGEGRTFSGVSTDTRTLREGDLFVALRGPSFDGHTFLEAAASAGAAGAVVERGAVPSSAAPAGELLLYEVTDTLEALGALGRYRRRALKVPVMAITGSSGKTTAKDLLTLVLSTTHSVHATRGNLNNRVGVPLTLLATPEGVDAVVVEMGTSEPGEIAALVGIAEPDLGMVTTVSESHLEGLGDLEGVLEEKLDLPRGLRPGGTAVVGDEPAALPSRTRALSIPTRVAGLSEAADPEWRGELLDVDGGGRWLVRIPTGTFRCGIPGRHGVRNALLALAAGDLLGVPAQRGFAAVEGAQAPALRGEFLRVGDLTLVVDCYNANPQSTRAALQLLSDLPADHGRVAVLGSMLELGPGSEAFHHHLLEWARTLPLRLVVGVGEFAEPAEQLRAATQVSGSASDSRTGSDAVGGPGSGGGPEFLGADTPAQAWTLLRSRLHGGETVLLKASRGVALEQLLPRFREAFGSRGGTA
jgi:UDP-N-acetylmuramoyl-tripeptide--D-alanyl-D-alanine ligase